eukprot:UN24178
MGDILALGRTRPLEFEDMYKNSDPDDVKQLHKNFKEAWSNRGGWSLLSILYSLVWKRHVKLSFFLFFEELGRVVAIYSMVYLLEYIQGEHDETVAYCAVLGLFLGATFNTIIHHMIFFGQVRLGEQLRATVSCAVFEHMTKLSPEALQSVETGHVTTLIANDAYRFVQCMKFAHFVYFCPALLTLYLFLLYQIIGWYCLICLFAMAILLPCQLICSHYHGTFRTKAVKYTDGRTKTVQEAILGSELMKMFNWELPFMNRIEEFRVNELRLSYILHFYVLSWELWHGVDIF